MLRDLSDDRLRRWCHEQRCDDKGLHESRFHDLRVLALALVAECHQGVVDFHEAEKHFRMAESELVLGSGDSEIRATLYELQADFVQARGLHFPALGYVEAAVKLVAKCQIPGRLAESLTRKGIILMRANSAGKAAEVLANALEKMPGNGFPLLRLETRHRLAAAEVQSGDFKSALKHLRAGKHLYKRYPQKLRDTQRQWLLGVSYLYTRKFKRAEKPLREALDRYCKLRLWEGAAQALANLAQLYIVTNRNQAFVELEREFCRLVQSAAGRKRALAGLRRVAILAEKLGIAAPRLRELLRELEEQEKGLVN